MFGLTFGVPPSLLSPPPSPSSLPPPVYVPKPLLSAELFVYLRSAPGRGTCYPGDTGK